jgi:hypothetical protein
VERALGTLDRRLAGTGLCLSRGGWDSYRLTARPGSWGVTRQNGCGLPTVAGCRWRPWAAALLSHIITGTATAGLNRVGPLTELCIRCPVSPNLAQQHVADLQRARFAETASSCLSH